MKKIVSLFILLVIAASVFSSGAEAKVRFFGKKSDKSINSNACVMSYTDIQGKETRVVRGNAVVVYIKNIEG